MRGLALFFALAVTTFTLLICCGQVGTTHYMVELGCEEATTKLPRPSHYTNFLLIPPVQI